MRALIFACLIAYGLAAHAGDFFEKDGVAIRGYDPVSYFTQQKPVRGSAAFKAEHRGSTFYFASQANRDAFAANPTKYAPQYNGFCAYGVAGGYKAAIDPAAFTVVNDKLYLNYNSGVQRQWRADTPGFITKADKNWPQVVQQTKVID